MRWLLLVLMMLPLRASDTLHGGRSTDGDFLEIEEVLSSEGQVGEARAYIDDETTSKILADESNLVPQQFKASPYFYPFVRFWFGIYTRYTSDHIVLHDKSDLGIVYGVLDFSRVGGDNINRFAKASILQSISNEKVAELKKVLNELANGSTASKNSLTILKLLQDSGSPPPPEAAARRRYFLERAANIRTQTGQRNLIEKGIVNMAPLAPFYSRLFKEFELPPQLLAIPFLESSFNNSAHSRVGALGIWQFMPLIASYFMPKRNQNMDYRMNPLISSVAALHLLRENKMILDSWDLAVTAYNSGTKHLVKARREHRVKTLEEVFKTYEHPHLGFASKNFYAEFIALVYTLANRDVVFPDEKNFPTLNPDKLHIALAKCPFSVEKTKKALGKDGERFAELNPHLRKPKLTYPRGTIVVSYDNLGKGFLRLSMKQLETSRPHKWATQWLKNQSCSTR